MRIRGFNATVHREQEVWGEYGIYTAHKHMYLFQNHLQKISQDTQKSGPNTTQKQPQKPPESKNHSEAAKGRKKPIVGDRVRHRARQKDPKLDLQATSRAPKIIDLYAIPKNINCGVSLETAD